MYPEKKALPDIDGSQHIPTTEPPHQTNLVLLVILKDQRYWRMEVGKP
jgi:hypothetical protein